MVAAATITLALSLAALPAQAAMGRPHAAGAVYVLSNQAAGNAVVTGDGRYAYTGNGGGSQSISGYDVDRHGSLQLFADGGKTATAAAGVSDIALSAGSHFLYARLGDGTIGAFAVGHDGTLNTLPVASGLPAGAAGIAAR